MYDVEWVKSLPKSELCYANLLTYCCIYHYNMKYPTIARSIRIKPATAKGYNKISVLLRTPSDADFKMEYYLSREETAKFIDMALRDFE